MRTKEHRELQFIPCNLHPEIQAVEMGVNEQGVVVFVCRACQIARDSMEILDNTITTDGFGPYPPSASILG